MNLELKRKIPTVQEIRAMYPLSREDRRRKAENDEKISEIFTGKSSRFLLIIGPCSADRADAVVDYCRKLVEVQEKVKDKILIVPRVYTNKPRTTGDGYKGMLHQPDPTGEPNMLKGLIATRRLHIQVLEETGLSTADEMLYPGNQRYLSDVLSYVAVGARSVENQQHRLTASGQDIPVGMKNPTSGDLSVMMNSITAAQHPHTFLYENWEASSKGNPMAHAILRGYVNRHGQSSPNYHYEDLVAVSELYAETELKNPAIVVDTNHANSGKKFYEQPRIAKEVLHSMRHNRDVARIVKGLMIESYLEDGKQGPGECTYGKSITDPCLGWEKTERLILDLAELL
ncbi:MAG: 3-deoxy-7-phosphoheptulonate synthase [Mobilibacterium timonense]|uniref:3-deoxy-7-phosphoheptulonate synthase n=1 Tax=Mobilibacterium timonense TaxID=1871012 RepID=UPI00235434DA|nr:3-deoxy-7-phosphoheptulonate synthase [Mobilibacterium timonense]MBM6990538.1 3-deoxy-7-phosphoheptulonate synthase [Mobilibacterium timonense]